MTNRVFGAGSAPAAAVPAVSASGQTDLFGTAVASEEIVEEEVPVYKTIDEVPHAYKTVANEAELKEVVATALQAEAFCFDTETTALDLFEAELVGVSLTWEAHQGVYIPIAANF